MTIALTLYEFHRLHPVATPVQATQPSTKEDTMSAEQTKNRGWTVVLAGTGINLALGILYTWSIFKGAISDSIHAGGAFNWDPAAVNDPYAVCCLVFAGTMILAGKLQDRFGPRITCVVGGLLVGLGFFWISQTTSYWAWVAGFGILAGMGIGFGYSAATPPALKWFPPARTGLIAGIVVSGFGLASVYIAPLATYLVGHYGLQQAMMIFGIAFAVVVGGFGLVVANPPEGFVPAGGADAMKTKAIGGTDISPSGLFADVKFYTLWLCYFIGAGAGLMVIGSAKGLARASMGEMAFVVVAVMAVGNAAGRLVAGVVSDRIGRANTLTILLVFQAALMFLAIPGLSGQASPVFVALLVTFMVFNYGTNLSLFPSFAKDYWGMKHFGMNYGILFSAWGVGAFMLVRVAEMLKVKTGGFTTSFAVAGVLLLVGAMMSLSLRPQPGTLEAEASAAVGDEDGELVYQESGNP
jgi:MFS family permease